MDQTSSPRRWGQALKACAALLLSAMPALAGNVEWRIRDDAQMRTFTLAGDEVFISRAKGSAAAKSSHDFAAEIEARLPGSKVIESSEREALIRLPSGSQQGATAGALSTLTDTTVEPVLYLKNRPRTEATRRYATSRLVVNAENRAKADEIGRSVQAEEVKDSAARLFWILRFKTPEAALDAATLLQERGVYVEPMLRLKRFKRFIPNDLIFPLQFNLRNTGQNLGTPGIDANVVPAWNITQGGGVTIAIIDDSLEIRHPDLRPNCESILSNLNHDFNGGDNNPSPDRIFDNHGTAVGGVAAARGNNGIGVSGAAPRARLVGLRLISGFFTDEENAEAFNWRTDVVDVSNNSWGPFDGAGLGGPGVLAEAALADACELGRDGKGVVFVFAGGNGREFSDNSNYDGFANSPYTIAVGACTNTGRQTFYSEPGANLRVCTPSNGGTLGVYTTDVTDEAGYNQGGSNQEELFDADYTRFFGGTSASAPLTSGVVALVLAAQPNLGWRDVQEILMATARKISPADRGWHENGAGFFFNHKFGAGLINAGRAVVEALDWTNLGERLQQTQSQNVIEEIVPDNNPVGITRTFDFSGEDPLRVEHVQVTLALSHEHRSDVEITLTSPAGTVSVLANRHDRPPPFFGDDDKDYFWTFMTVHNWGENNQGVWTLRIRDLTSGFEGTLHSASITLSGAAKPDQELQFAAATFVVRENDGQALLTVERTGGSSGIATVNYVARPATATRGDFVLSAGTLTFADGETSKQISIPIINDRVQERKAAFVVVLKDPEGAGLGSQKKATVVIIDDDRQRAAP